MPKESKELARRFEVLIKRHAGLRMEDDNRLKDALDRLVPTFQAARKTWADEQRASASDFNLFAVLGVESDEVRHSKILTWLLDHRIEQGSHAQGSLGFRLFLKQLKQELFGDKDPPVTDYADVPNYWVHREVSGGEARVDIEIAARNRFLIHIENKIYSIEGDDQTHREWRDLQQRAKALGVSRSACHAIYLTLDGSEARNENFRSVSWNRIALVLDIFAEKAQPEEVRLFARHYAKAVRKLAIVERKGEEVLDVEVQRG